MKISVVPLSLVIALAATQTIASTTEVTLTGTLMPSACTPTLSNGGVIDFGRVSFADLIPDGLPEKRLDLSIKCGAPTRFALINSDNRIESAPESPLRYGLGMHNEEKIGYMTIHTTPALVDDVLRDRISSLDGGQSWSNAVGPFQRAQDRPNFLYGFGDVNDVSSGPTPAQNLSTTLLVYARVDSTIDFSSDVQLDGSTTFEIRYL
ncbi:DUF1120 domain-containing protein [Pseudomonas sp. GD03860]|uniref:DUF1120 domain-containing protein n=1 Tax=Pseudomonas TaxID=286 RepID=UPI0023632998|nr:MULTISPECIES: DUF1120 domain-containing protein [Pseudomonas]MDD2060847.1 DUF1120 domain-containing protein [Pseudomonas putida]MDH0638329.1 DUF1120 domain-containing protein [Pseudomonas sp. GD03860]